MTRSIQKTKEKQHAELFLHGLVEYKQLDDGEAPDFWVRRDGRVDFGLEITEYHPPAEGCRQARRCEIEARWREEIWPKLDSERRKLQSLEEIAVDFHFRDPRLPQGREHALLVQELIQAVSKFAHDVNPYGNGIEVCFGPSETVKRAGGHLGRWRFLPDDEWPCSARHISSLAIRLWPGLHWPPWNCPLLDAAWPSPVAEEFVKVLCNKASKFTPRSKSDLPIWLLIVCETQNDLQSHSVPSNPQDAKHLVEAIEQCGFAFNKSPFEQVWLLSEFNGRKTQLYPAGH
jgi:hypothetical protein